MSSIWDSLSPRARTYAAGAWLLFLFAGWWLLYPMGLINDEFVQIAAARRLTPGDFMLGRGGPVPFHMLQWKLAMVLSPDRPPVFLCLTGWFLHSVTSVLLFVLFAEFFNRETAAALALMAALHRAGNEALLWGAATVEIQVLFFAVLAVLFWRRGTADPRWYWAALVPSVLCAVAKPTGVVMPVLLAAHVGWLEDGETRWRRAAGPLAAAFALAALAFCNSWMHPLWYKNHEQLGALRDVPYLLGASLQLFSGLFFGLFPEPLNVTEALGFLLVVMLPWIYWRSGRVGRFGLLWSAIFLAPPLVAFGYAQSRYEYTPKIGALLVTGVLLDGLFRHIPAAMVRTAIAVVVSVFVWFNWNDYRKYRDIGQVGIELRDLVRKHHEEIRAADWIWMPGGNWPEAPILTAFADFSEYYTNVAVPVRITMAQDCSEGFDQPCLKQPVRVPEALGCVRSGTAPCVVWTPAKKP